MAISNNTFTDGLSGNVGGNIFRRRKSGKVILSKRPGRRTTPPTQGQQDVRDRFKMGVLYAKAVMADPAKKALYETPGHPDVSAYNLALKDAVKPPTVRSIDATAYLGQPGNAIIVRALDDFKVASVKLSVHKADGSLLEEGNAVLQDNALDWLYTATLAIDSIAGVTISAVAKDLPGNTGTMEIKL